jgi:hypothetical protein
MNILKRFEDECKLVRERYYKQDYQLTGRSRDRRFTLKPVYSAIANKHLFTVNQKGHIFYPAEQIEDICKKLNIPISQVITIGVI